MPSRDKTGVTVGGQAGTPVVPVAPEPDNKGFYSEFFGFRERPFTLVPDPDLIVWSPQYSRAFSILELGVVLRSPVTLLTGAIGCGKTTLVRELIRQIDDTVRIGLISNAQGGRGELIQWVLNALGVHFEPGAGYVHLFQALQDFLIEEYAAGRRILLIFDEAQNLSNESLEELRMLTNINAGKDEVIQLLLVGQPELSTLIRQPELVQLAQRIAVSFHLGPLDAADCDKFIVERLRSVGGSGKEFDPRARKMVFEATGGVPRLINQLCDMALLYAWTDETAVVGPAIVRQVIQDNILFAGQRPPAGQVQSVGQPQTAKEKGQAAKDEGEA